MITGLTAAFTTMVQSQLHVVETKITITLPAGPYSDFTFAADNVTIEAQTVTDLPDQSRLEVGYPSMGATFTLSGLVDLTDATKTAAWLFRRSSTTSPLYRKDALQAPVTIDVGLYPANSGGTAEMVRKFTGYIDKYVEVEDGGVQFTCIDKRTILRSIPNTPPVVTAAPYNAGLTSEYALDSILRAASSGAISSWPAQRPQCVLAAGLRGSLWPEIGTLAASAAIGGAQPYPVFAPGAMGTALQAITQDFTTTSDSSVVYSLANGGVGTGTKAFVEFWVNGLTATSHHYFALIPVAGPTGVNYFTLDVRSTGITVGTIGPSYTWVTAISSGAHYIGVAFTFPAVGGTASSATIYLDGASQATGTLTWPAPRDATPVDSFWVSPGNGSNLPGTIEAVQVTTETSPARNNAFTPQAVFDSSLNALTVVPEVSGDPWAIIQQIADAELGVAGFDESGIFRFHNRNTIKSVASVRDITTAETLQIETHSGSVINRGQVGFTGWNFGAAAQVWSLGSVWRVPKRSTGANVFVRYATVTDGSLLAAVNTTLTFMNNAGTTTPGGSYYRTSTDAAGTRDHPGVTIVLTQINSTKVKIEITNATSQDCYLVASADHALPAAGTPVLIIGATPVTQANESQVDYQYPAASAGGAASTRFGEVAWQQTGNAWIQDPDSALQLATDVVLDGYVPRPDLTGIAILPDPRLQLIDVVHIVDPDTTYVDEYARIFGWTLSLSSSSWSMTLDARSVAPPGGWILGVAGRSELAQTTYLQGV